MTKVIFKKKKKNFDRKSPKKKEKKTMRPLELVRPFLGLLPDIEPPQRRVPFREKVLYTGVCLFVFLVASQLPLYGIKSNAGADPFYWARVIMASNRYASCPFLFFPFS